MAAKCVRPKPSVCETSSCPNKNKINKGKEGTSTWQLRTAADVCPPNGDLSATPPDWRAAKVYQN